MATIPGFSAQNIRDWYGPGMLSSGPQAGQSGTSGLWGGVGLPGVGMSSPYQWQDVEDPYKGTAQTADYRPAVAKGGVAPTGYTFEPGMLDAAGKAIAAIPIRGALASKDYGPMYTSTAAKTAYGLSQRAQQEAAAGRAGNLSLGNDILAGYDANIGTNRSMSDRMMAMNAGYGDSMRQQLDADYKQRLAQSNASAMRRGLGNTTIRDSLNRGVTSAYDQSRMQLGDQLTQRNIGLVNEAMGRENQGVGQRLGFLGSIQNDYPTSADYGNYLLQAGVLEETKGSRK